MILLCLSIEDPWTRTICQAPQDTLFYHLPIEETTQRKLFSYALFLDDMSLFKDIKC